MRKPIRIKCDCGKKLSLDKLVTMADRAETADLTCPYCGKKVGTVQDN